MATPDETARHVRGSSALMLGKMLSIALSLVIQVLLVRSLSRSDFGAFGYALSIASMASIVVALGTTKAVPRFLAVYDEERDRERFVGTLVFEASLILGLGTSMFVGILAARSVLEGRVIDEPVAFSLTAILILTAPQEALDKVLEAFAAVSGETRAIFLRKYVLDPVLRLAAVVALIALDASVTFLAVGYVVAGLVGSLLYLSLVISHLRERELLGFFRRGRFRVPGASLVRFSGPILVHDLVFIAITTIGVLMIGHLDGTEEVASYRAVFPVARMNQVIGWTFAVLYMPLAGRMFARRDLDGMRDAYWRSAAWLCVLTLPVFLLTGVFSRAVTDALFGAEYADSATILTLLAAGYYLNMSLGFNTLTLQTFGHLRFTVVVDILSLAAYGAVALVLIPEHGATGAAVAATVTLVVLNLGAQVGVWRMKLGFFDPEYAIVYLSVAAATGGCALVAWLIEPPLPLAVVIVGVVSIGVLRINRRRLDVIETFPELARVPLAKALFR